MMTDEQVDELIYAIRSIAHGDSMPSGLEALSMAVAGEGLGTPLGKAIESVAEAIHDVADAIRENGAA